MANGLPAHRSRLVELSDIIQSNTRRIEEFLRTNGWPEPTFDIAGPPDFPVPTTNEDIQQARRAVVNATQELHDLMVGPRETVRWLAWSAIYHFNVAAAVPLDGEISYAELAQATKVDEVNIKRLIRHAITNRIFREPRPGYVAHTAASRLLCDDPQMIDWVGLCTSEFFPAAANTVDAMNKYPNSQEPNETGYSLHWCPGEPMFANIGKDPKRAKRFGGAMASLTGGEGYEVDYLVNGYPWEELDKKNGLIVDIGGSIGFVCVALAQKFPNLKFVVQDLPKTVAEAEGKIPSELQPRIEIQPHDFYTPQPVKDADVYFFRWICHNQSDKYGVKMLQQLIPALKPGAKVVINDNCLPEPGTVDMWDDKITRSMDLTMLELLNAKERDDDDWRELFQMADPRFKYLGHTTPKGSRMSIMEAVWQSDLN